MEVSGAGDVRVLVMMFMANHGSPGDRSLGLKCTLLTA